LPANRSRQSNASAPQLITPNGGFPSLPFEDWSFMSLDLTVQLTRQPDGEWIAVTSDSLASRTGIGLGDAELYDATGRIGRAVATLLVEPR
jgi:acyl-CoA thioesterase